MILLSVNETVHHSCQSNASLKSLCNFAITSHPAAVYFQLSESSSSAGLPGTGRLVWLGPHRSTITSYNCLPLKRIGKKCIWPSGCVWFSWMYNCQSTSMKAGFLTTLTRHHNMLGGLSCIYRIGDQSTTQQSTDDLHCWCARVHAVSGHMVQ